MLLSIISITLFVVYSILVIYYWRCWQAIPVFMPTGPASTTRISVIIPARNEENNIGTLLEAVSRQTYPASLIEVIVVDDHSTDRTASVAAQFPGVRLVTLDAGAINSYKKKAIESGIAVATGDLIVTTDADCIPGENWLLMIAGFKEKTDAVFIAAPVVIDCNSSLLQVFQAMDFMMLQGITGAVVHKRQLSMCNGANLAYERKAFAEVNGFAGIDDIASGDDMLLMYKIAERYPGKVFYLKHHEAIVSTQPMKSWKEFYNQRIRWASKAAKYNDRRIFPVLLVVYLFNLSFLVLLVAGAWNAWYWLLLLLLLAMKTLVELSLFRAVAEFFNKQWAIKFLLPFQPLHIFYTISSGLLSQWGKYEWKGRKVR